MDSIVTLTLTIDRPLFERLRQCATESGRSTSWLLDQALRRYLDDEPCSRANGADADPKGRAGR